MIHYLVVYTYLVQTQYILMHDSTMDIPPASKVEAWNETSRPLNDEVQRVYRVLLSGAVYPFVDLPRKDALMCVYGLPQDR